MRHFKLKCIQTSFTADRAARTRWGSIQLKLNPISIYRRR